MPSTYLEALAIKYPKVNVSSLDSGSEYEMLVHEGGDPMPTKGELDIAKLSVDKEFIWRDIQMLRDTRKAAGVKVGAHWFHSDDTSRIQHLGLVMMGANMPSNLMWKTMAGTFVLMTPTLAPQIFMQIAVNDQAIFAKAEFHRAEINKLDNPYQYNITTGWPPIFGE